MVRRLVPKAIDFDLLEKVAIAANPSGRGVEREGETAVFFPATEGNSEERRDGARNGREEKDERKGRHEARKLRASRRGVSPAKSGANERFPDEHLGSEHLKSVSEGDEVFTGTSNVLLSSPIAGSNETFNSSSFPLSPPARNTPTASIPTYAPQYADLTRPNETLTRPNEFITRPSDPVKRNEDFHWFHARTSERSATLTSAAGAAPHQPSSFASSAGAGSVDSRDSGSRWQRAWTAVRGLRHPRQLSSRDPEDAVAIAHDRDPDMRSPDLKDGVPTSISTESGVKLSGPSDVPPSSSSSRILPATASASIVKRRARLWGSVPSIEASNVAARRLRLPRTSQPQLPCADISSLFGFDTVDEPLLSPSLANAPPIQPLQPSGTLFEPDSALAPDLPTFKTVGRDTDAVYTPKPRDDCTSAQFLLDEMPKGARDGERKRSSFRKKKGAVLRGKIAAGLRERLASDGEGGRGEDAKRFGDKADDRSEIGRRHRRQKRGEKERVAGEANKEGEIEKEKDTDVCVGTEAGALTREGEVGREGEFGRGGEVSREFEAKRAGESRKAERLRDREKRHGLLETHRKRHALPSDGPHTHRRLREKVGGDRSRRESVLKFHPDSGAETTRLLKPDPDNSSVNSASAASTRPLSSLHVPTTRATPSFNPVRKIALKSHRASTGEETVEGRRSGKFTRGSKPARKQTKGLRTIPPPENQIAIAENLTGPGFEKVNKFSIARSNTRLVPLSLRGTGSIASHSDSSQPGSGVLSARPLPPRPPLRKQSFTHVSPDYFNPGSGSERPTSGPQTPVPNLLGLPEGRVSQGLRSLSVGDALERTKKSESEGNDTATHLSQSGSDTRRRARASAPIVTSESDRHIGTTRDRLRHRALTVIGGVFRPKKPSFSQDEHLPIPIPGGTRGVEERREAIEAEDAKDAKKLITKAKDAALEKRSDRRWHRRAFSHTQTPSPDLQAANTQADRRQEGAKLKLPLQGPLQPRWRPLDSDQPGLHTWPIQGSDSESESTCKKAVDSHSEVRSHWRPGTPSTASSAANRTPGGLELPTDGSVEGTKAWGFLQHQKLILPNSGSDQSFYSAASSRRPFNDGPLSSSLTIPPTPKAFDREAGEDLDFGTGAGARVGFGVGFTANTKITTSKKPEKLKDKDRKSSSGSDSALLIRIREVFGDHTSPLLSSTRRQLAEQSAREHSSANMGNTLECCGDRHTDMLSRKMVENSQSNFGFLEKNGTKESDLDKFDLAFENNDIPALVSLISSREKFSHVQHLHPWAYPPQSVGALALTQLAALAATDDPMTKQLLRDSGAIKEACRELSSNSLDRSDASLVCVSFLSINSRSLHIHTVTHTHTHTQTHTRTHRYLHKHTQ